MANDEVLNRAAEVNEQFRQIELTAETVTRPAGPHTPTVHSFLRHLRGKGLDCVPEPVSLEGETETLRFIEGESGGDGWKHQHDEQGLRSAASLLRRIHDASADWVPPNDAVFAAPGAEGGDVFVNGDPGPWNFVWRDGQAVALIDWDFLHRAPRLSDVASHCSGSPRSGMTRQHSSGTTSRKSPTGERASGPSSTPTGCPPTST